MCFERVHDRAVYGGPVETLIAGARRLRSGYTTGSCAAAAAKAATLMLLSGKDVESISITTPKGVQLSLAVQDRRRDDRQASCAIRKDSGDDPDITNGMLVYAKATRTASGVTIGGGEGVGRVTKPGLDQPVGAAAINSVPRRMIEACVRETCETLGYEGGISIQISIPGGEEMAAKTFNPRLGIVGGLSVLGTSGIVEPMSEAALVDTIRVELNVLRASGSDAALLVPGNIGEDLATSVLKIDARSHVKCSNYIGDALDMASELGFSKILLVGHAGKLVKLVIGAYNTHSKYGDGRMEALAACAIRASAPIDVLRELLDCATTDAAMALLEQRGFLEGTAAVLGERIDTALRRRVSKGIEVGFVCCYAGGVLAQSPNAEELLSVWRF